MSAEVDPAAVLRAHYAGACPGEFSLEPVDAAEINSRNWVVRMANVPRYILKRGPFDRNIDFYGEFCHREPLLPRLVSAADGKPYAISGGEAYRLIEYREGHAFPESELALVEAARALAQLQRALREVAGRLEYSERYAPLTPQELDRVRARLPQIAAQLPGWYAELDAIESSRHLPRGWIHHDYHPGNVLFRGDRVSAILDMDSLGTDFRMQAVAFAASRFAGADAPRARRFLAAYGAADPLSAAELEQYPAFVRRQAVRRINWILRVNVLEGRDAWRGDLEKHLAVLR